MPFQIIRNDITRVKADAIVNTTNPRPKIGWGTDSAVYKAAGEEHLLAERRKIGDIAPGNAVHTPAFRLDAKYIIHTVGPVWVDGGHQEAETLRSCYENSLALADSLKCESIAFPLISTGSYGFPRELALNTAMSAIGKFLLTHDMNVTLVVFDRKSVTASAELIGEVREYISEHGVSAAREAEYPDGIISASRLRRNRDRLMADEACCNLILGAAIREDMQEDNALPPTDTVCNASAFEDDLTKVLETNEDTFQERLFRLIDNSGMDDVTVYKKANIDRKLFSAIKCKKDYRPTKKTVVAFAIALELDLPAMMDLLRRAGIAFSPTDKFDLIISFFVTHGNYDMMQINSVLFDYDQPLLGA